MLIERVLRTTDSGLELEYDYPTEATARARASDWKFPVRIFKPFVGGMQLLDREAMEARADAWLEAAELPRDACGHWYFTWNAFQIECDPEAALHAVEAFELRPGDLREGGVYHDSAGQESARFTSRTTASGASAYVAEMTIDAETFRRERAQSDVVVAEINREQLTLEDALRARAEEEITGTITVTFELNAQGEPWRRTRVVELEIRRADGVVENEERSEILTRRRLSAASPARDTV